MSLLFGRRALPSLLFILFCLSLGSCGSPSSAFPWTGARGERLAFSQTGRFPRGEEGLFGPTNAANEYVLERPLAGELGTKEGKMLAVELELRSSGLSVGLALASVRKQKLPEPHLTLPEGRVTVYLDLPQKGLRSLALAFSSPGGAATAKEDWALVKSISLAPEFHGLDSREKGALRVSADFVASASEGKTLWSFTDLAFRSGSGVPAFVLGWKNRVDEDMRIEAGHSLRLKAYGPRSSSLVPLAVLGDSSSTTGKIELAAPAGIGLETAFVEAVPAQEAEAVDLGVLLLLPPLAEAADFTYRAWDLLPQVYAFDFRDYAVQDLYLKRLAFFVEKRGFAGRLASDQEIAPLHGWNAHDYKAEDLAAFFSAAAKTGFKLNSQEERLRDFLLDKKLIRKQGGVFGSSGGAIISITQEAPAYLRKLFITHESLHAVFFADKDYREVVGSVWDSMSKEERWFWRLYFGWMNYDTGSDYLMANEVQAYLLQQPLAGTKKYFTETLPARLLEHHPELRGELEAYMGRYGDEFEKKASFLDGWLRRRYGLRAGSTALLR